MSDLVVHLSPSDVQAIAIALADELERRQLSHDVTRLNVAVPLLSLEEFAAELAVRMPARSKKAWSKWLYEAAPRGRVEGARRCGGRWWFGQAAVESIADMRPANERN